MKKLIITTCICVFMFASKQVSAQGYLVNDMACIAKSTEMVSNGLNQLSKLEQLTQISNGLKNAVGEMGLGSVIDVNTTLDSLLAFNELNPSLAWDAESIKVISPDWSSLTNAKASTQAIFYGNDKSTVSEASTVYQRRSDASRLSAVNGFSLSQHVREDIKTMPDQVRALATKAQQSQDLRSDIAVNTETLLTLNKQLAVMESLLASLVEIEATRTISNNAEVNKSN